ncbi:MAG: hypothetical protein K1X72_15880 [Pyrinomonadaceae bacterium]|nr:hypothetical protein [Pyrinomonadaceae bacterium]
MKDYPRFNYAIILTAIYLIVASFSNTAQAQGKIIAKLNFDPKSNGFGFPNYGNEHAGWKGDLGVADLISMFGAEAVCKSGNSPQNCVLKAAAQEWMTEQLDGMKGGHCEGMSTTALRFNSGLPFKGMNSPADFLSGATSPFSLTRGKTLDNYIAYYFVTQSFSEVARPSKETAQKGPVAIVNMLVEAMNAGKDTYSLGIYKMVNGQPKDGHAITPFAVEDDGDQFKIHIYDNNNPGETKFMTVEKGGKQTWKYVAAINPNESEDAYIGDTDTKTLELTATSWRDGKCFEAPFAPDGKGTTGCSSVSTGATRPPTPASAAPKPGEGADFSVTGDANMMIVQGDGKKVGFNPADDKFYDEIPNAELDSTKGGKGENLPHYQLPFHETGEPFTVVLSGKDQKKESDGNFNYSGPGFSVGFENLKLDPNETLAFQVSPDGEELTFLETPDGEMPTVKFAFDTDGKSYKAEIRGTDLKKDGNDKVDEVEGDPSKLNEEFEKHPALTVKFDDESGKLQIKDNDGDEDEFDVDLTQFGADGHHQHIQLNDLGEKDSGEDAYEIEVGEWDGGDDIPVKHDDEGNGFDDDQEEEVKNENNDIEDEDDPGNQSLFVYNGYYSFFW